MFINRKIIFTANVVVKDEPWVHSVNWEEDLLESLKAKLQKFTPKTMIADNFELEILEGVANE